MVNELTPVGTVKFEEFKRETANDKNLEVVCKVLIEGWPDHIHPFDAKPYWTVRDESTIVDGVLLKSAKIIFPQSFRKEMLSKMHEVHQGISRSKERARDILYWPGVILLNRRNGYVLFKM